MMSSFDADFNADDRWLRVEIKREIPPPHSITSSALASSAGGMVKLSKRAAFKLQGVGCSTGMYPENRRKGVLRYKRFGLLDRTEEHGDVAGKFELLTRSRRTPPGGTTLGRSFAADLLQVQRRAGSQYNL
jgi:hypothetical protein